MFKVGNWVWGLDGYGTKKFLTYAMIVGDTTDYYICIENFNAEDRGRNAKDFMKLLYDAYTEQGELEGFIILEKENTFATEQEAREALEVMK